MKGKTTLYTIPKGCHVDLKNPLVQNEYLLPPDQVPFFKNTAQLELLPRGNVLDYKNE